MSNRIPKSAAANNETKKIPKVEDNSNFDKFYPAWRLGKFDYSSRWGLNNLLGKFSFRLSTDLENAIIDLDDEDLLNSIIACDNIHFDSVDDFWRKLSLGYKRPLPANVVRLIARALPRDGFFQKIYPKLKSYESNTWKEILEFKHRRNDKMVTNNHPVKVEKFCKEAKDRLEELKYAEDELFSLRLEGKIRIYGFRVHNYLEILWIDLNHEIYPTSHN